MSKEQTPITAEKRLKELGLMKEGYSHFIITLGNDIFELVQIMEQYAKAKVLEAQAESDKKWKAILEREVIKAMEKVDSLEEWETYYDYFKTEVEPRYKN